MATYKEIQEYVKLKYGKTVKSCWIAHVKELNDLPRKVSPRRYDPNKRVHPCPDRYVDKIEDAFRYFKMI
jgi:hypothetical protein